MLIFPFLFYVEREHLSGGSGSNVSYHLITQIGGIQLDASGIEKLLNLGQWLTYLHRNPWTNVVLT